MDAKALVQLGLQILSCSQKELALRLGVSPTQISKWKKGEHMSRDMEEKIREILTIGDRNPEFVLWAGSLQEADKWEKLIHFLAEMAIDHAETGYDTYPLHDELGLLSCETFSVLRGMGVDLPKKFPDELDLDYDNDDFYDERILSVLLEDNPYSSLIYKIYKSLNDVYGFYSAYLSDLLQEDELIGTSADNIEPCLMQLAACKIEDDKGLASRFGEFKYGVTKDYEDWINLVKETAFRAGIPLRAELLELVYDSHDSLGHEAEAESFGFNSTRIHPDIYMNELLCGMRMIHQVLPAIMKKLGIYDEFELDESNLRIR